MLRFAVGHIYAVRSENPFLTVITVNMVGSLLIGMVVGKIPRVDRCQPQLPALMRDSRHAETHHLFHPLGEQRDHRHLHQ